MFKDFKDFTPREQSERITKGIDKPHFIGIKSAQVKKQELTSHIQNYQETFTRQENKAWKVKLKELIEAID